MVINRLKGFSVKESVPYSNMVMVMVISLLKWCINNSSGCSERLRDASISAWCSFKCSGRGDNRMKCYRIAEQCALCEKACKMKKMCTGSVCTSDASKFFLQQWIAGLVHCSAVVENIINHERGMDLQQEQAENPRREKTMTLTGFWIFFLAF